MNFISDIIIVTLLSAFLLIVVAVISYKLGKKEKSKMIINERDRIIENESEINPQIKTPENKKELKADIKVETDSKPAENKLKKENMVSVKELYSAKIEEETNVEENSNVHESEKLSEIKFLKYTSNGYKPAKGDSESRVVRWR
jgi:hypothetical protein